MVAGRAAQARRARSPTPRSRTSAASCGSSTADGSNQEGLYWRYEMGVRGAESRLGSVTGGNGSIYAVRRADYVEVDPRFGHDLSLPYLMVQRGRRAVYEPRGARVREADADERDRVPPQGADVRALLADRAARQDAAPPAARSTCVEIVSHRLLRYGSGCCTSCCSRRRSRSSRTGWVYDVVLAAQLAAASPPPPLGVGIARYYVLVTWATLVALWNYLRRGVPATWEPAEGTR